jgi:serine phosphatase RsbU (regulator of sigma subunit)
MKPFRSLRLKFVLYFVGFMTASMVLLGRSLFEQEHNALLRELQKRLVLQASNLEVQAREALETNDDLALLTSLRGMRTMDDFEFAAVVHLDGTLFAHSNVHLVGQSLDIPPEAAALRQGSFMREVRGGGVPPRIEVWSPVISTLSGSPDRIGLVCVSVSKSPLLAAIDQAKWSAMRVGAVFALLGILGTALIARTVTKPIGLLVERVRRIGAGDLSHKMRLKRSDEIGLLSDSFDHMTDELQRAQQEILRQQLFEKELEVAAKIQSALLPSSAPRVSGFGVAAMTVPARIVGGDFYDYVPLRDGRMAFLVADVAGKGVSAGLVMAYTRSAARSTFNYTSSPHEALAALNEQLLRDFDHTTFVTMLCMVLDPERQTLHLANAGHPPVLWCRANGELRMLRLRGVALGILPRERFGDLLEQSQIELGCGDLVFGYTDGVNESHSTDGTLYGEARLVAFGKAHAHDEPDEFLTALRREIEAFAAGGEQFDDITALVLKVDAAAALVASGSTSSLAEKGV